MDGISGRGPEQDTDRARRRRRREPSTPATAPYTLSRRIVAVSALSLAGLTAATGAAVYAEYDRLNSNIRTVDIDSALSRRVKDGSLNILLIGSDSRAGANSEYGSGLVDTGARSDTTMLLHVAADRKSAVVASIPRDTMVQLPGCQLPGGGYSQPQFGMFNSAFTLGGAACTVGTVESLTSIPIDHVLAVDFTGFKEIVDAIGGIPVTLSQPVDDEDAKLHLPAGTTVVDGEQALAFVRARHAFGNGSDIGRMGRQQEFLSATLETLAHNGTLDDPSKLLKVLEAATKALTTDQDLGSLSALSALAMDLKSVPRSAVTYLTVPWEGYAPDPNRVQFAPAAQDLFDALLADEPVPADVTATDPSTGATPTPQPSTGARAAS